MKLSELINNENLDTNVKISLLMLKVAFGDRDLDLDELEKESPGIKDFFLNLKGADNIE